MKIFRGCIALVAASSLLASCSLGFPTRPSGLRISATEYSSTFDPNRDYSDELKRLIPKEPYTGPVTIRIDTSLLASSKADRRVLGISNKHSGHNQHAAHDQSAYFDPDMIATDIEPHVGDRKLPESDIYIGAASINGQTSEHISGYIEVKFKTGSESAFEEFKAKYNAEVLSEANGVFLLKIDESKAKISSLPDVVKNANAILPNPITELSFSSLAAAQTATALLDLAYNLSEHVDFALPTSLPEHPFVYDGGRPPIDRSGPDPVIDTAEIATVLAPGVIRYKKSSEFDWVRDIELPQARLDSTGAGIIVATQDSGYDLRNIQDISQSKIVHKANLFLPGIGGSGVSGSDPDLAAPFIDPRNDYPHAFHGNITASLIAADMDNGIGSVGVAPRAKLAQIRALFGVEHLDGVLNAIAVGARIIIVNSDWPCYAWQRYLGAIIVYKALTESNNTDAQIITVEKVAELVGGAHAVATYTAERHGIALIAPVGNANKRVDILDNPLKILSIETVFMFPASYVPAIGVGGAMQGFLASGNRDYNVKWTTSADNLGSSHGPAVDIYAPGDSSTIEMSTTHNDPAGTNGIAKTGGTSAAAPIVAGVAALILSKNPSLTPASLLDHLRQHFRPARVPKRFIVEPDGRLVPFVNAFESLRYLNTGGQREPQAQEIVGKIQYRDGVLGFYREELGYCGQLIHLDPQFDPDPSDPEKMVTVAGWYKERNGTRLGDQFEVIAIRETPGSVPCPTPTPPPPPSHHYRVIGVVNDAGSGTGISDVDVELREGVDACDGTVIARTQTDANGSYEFVNVAEGAYTVTISRTGYVRVCSNVSVNEANPDGNSGSSVVTTPSLPSGTTRFVLVWGETPTDLDSHLTGPTASGDRFHIYYGNPSYSDQGTTAVLDRDDTDSFGPETITNTVYTTQPGIYRYAVHDYSNRFSTSSMILSNSGAAVMVFRGDSLITTIRPTPGSSGTVWNVLEMDGSTGAIDTINTWAFESDPSYVVQGVPSIGQEFTRLLKSLRPKH